MLTKSEVEAHERRLWRLLAWQGVSIVLLVGGVLLGSDGWGKPLIVVGGPLFFVTGVRGSAYMLRDMRLRGANPIWTMGFVGFFGFFFWLTWRGAHPIPTKDNPGGRRLR